MTGAPPFGPAQPVAEISATWAIGRAWDVLKQDFWRFVVLGLIFMGIYGGAMMVGMCLFLVGMIPALSLVLAPLLAGLFRTVSERIDGRELVFANIFSAFKSRFGPSVMAYLVPSLSILLPIILLFASGITRLDKLLVLFQQMSPEDFRAGTEEVSAEIAALFASKGVFFLLMPMANIGISFLWLFFIFAGLEVWRHESGWEAAKASCRLVVDNFGKVFIFGFVMYLIGIVACVAGMFACGVGLFITMPLYIAWLHLGIVFLWRGLTGQNIPAAAGAEPAVTQPPMAQIPPAAQAPTPQAPPVAGPPAGPPEAPGPQESAGPPEPPAAQ